MAYVDPNLIIYSTNYNGSSYSSLVLTLVRAAGDGTVASATIQWGDGQTTSVTGTWTEKSTTWTHIYSTAGTYTVSIAYTYKISATQDSSTVTWSAKPYVMPFTTPGSTGLDPALFVNWIGRTEYGVTVYLDRRQVVGWDTSNSKVYWGDGTSTNIGTSYGPFAHTYSTAGTYTAYLWYKHSKYYQSVADNVDPHTWTVPYLPPGTPTLTLAAPTMVNNTVTTRATYSDERTGLSVQSLAIYWLGLTGDPTTIALDTDVAHQYLTACTVSVVAKATLTDTSIIQSNALEVVVANSLPLPSFIYQIAPDGLAVTFTKGTSTDPDGTVVSYTLTPDTGATPIPDVPIDTATTYAYPAYGVYHPVVRAVDDDGGYQDQAITLDLTHQPPTATYRTATDIKTATFTLTGLVAMDGATPVDATLRWLPDDPATTIPVTLNRSVSYTYPSANVYQAVLTVTDARQYQRVYAVGFDLSHATPRRSHTGGVAYAGLVSY